MSSDPPSRRAAEVLDLVGAEAPWLLQPELGTCVVGSTALAHACDLSGVAGPVAADVDLAWSLEVEQGRELLERHGVALATTRGNLARGTLALMLAGQRIEITSFRGPGPAATMQARIEADLQERDMTIGALAWWLGEDRMLDPCGGLRHWQEKRIVAVGAPDDRVATHPVRWLRYYRKAHALGFDLDPAIRKIGVDPGVLDRIPAEALAAEFQQALLGCASPGRLFLELHEIGLLARVAPELAPQFDGRPAGPVRHHPEVGQALHLILALEWVAAHTSHLPDADRLAVAVATLCHDLGKGFTPSERLPAHPGHERRGLPHVERLLRRLPGLTDGSSRRLTLAVCALHLEARRLRELRAGTLATLYQDYFRDRGFRPDLFALAVGADSGGRLGLGEVGRVVASDVEADVRWIQSACEAVDARALRERHPELEDFKRALHEARCKALAHHPR